jgi:hypothetical protein
MTPLRDGTGKEHDNRRFCSQASAVGPVAIEADAAQRTDVRHSAEKVSRRNDGRARDLDPLAPDDDGVTGLVKSYRP